MTTTFGQSALWRAEVIADFRLRGAERCAAASPSPGFPQILDSVLGVLAAAPNGPWVELGGGLGGASSWIERTTGRSVGLFDRSMPNLSAARRLFADLSVTCTDVVRLPIRLQSVAVAVVSGLVSLLVDLDPLLFQVEQVLLDGGFVAITDLWSAGPKTTTVGANTFRSLEQVSERAAHHGLDLVHVAVADAMTGWWSSSAEQVDDEIAARFASQAGFVEWTAERTHLAQVMEDELVIAAGLVLVRSKGADRLGGIDEHQADALLLLDRPD